VVRYVDCSDDPTNPLLVLEFVEGRTMNNVFKETPIAENIATQYAASLLNIVTALHSKGVIHRDISPSNIILSPTRGLVIIDFGTCQILRPIEGAQPPRYGKVIVKRGFSAPELLQGMSDERSDIFSVGATLLYLLTGKNPSDFTSNSEDLKTNLHSLGGRISNIVANIVNVAMSPDPNQRFQSAAAMSAALKETGAKGPRITIGDFTFELKADCTDVGRDHDCDSGCESLGFKHPPQIRIADPQKYIEKHHVRIWLENDGRCFVEDLKSQNRTVVKSKTGELKVLNPLEKIELHDGDVVGLAYSPTRGPYSTFKFKNAP
jgi:serine/threonine protein kinase